MKIELDISNPDFYKIISYSEDSFQTNDRIVKSNIIITKDQLIENWLEEGYSCFAMQHLEQVISLQPEIIILGTGKTLTFPNQEIFTYINSKNIGFEVMDTGAACRSYNLLIDEGRNAVACLFLSGN